MKTLNRKDLLLSTIDCKTLWVHGHCCLKVDTTGLTSLQFGGKRENISGSIWHGWGCFYYRQMHTNPAFLQSNVQSLSLTHTSYFQSSEVPDAGYYQEEKKVWLPYAHISPNTCYSSTWKCCLRKLEDHVHAFGISGHPVFQCLCTGQCYNTCAVSQIFQEDPIHAHHVNNLPTNHKSWVFETH